MLEGVFIFVVFLEFIAVIKLYLIIVVLGIVSAFTF